MSGALAVLVMNTTTCMNPTLWEPEDRAEEAVQHESTYALLVRSEERERTFLEIALCFLCALSAIAAIWQFAHQPIALPLNAVTTSDVAKVSSTPGVCAPEFRG
jgi:hypothetical protein